MGRRPGQSGGSIDHRMDPWLAEFTDEHNLPALLCCLTQRHSGFFSFRKSLTFRVFPNPGERRPISFDNTVVPNGLTEADNTEQ